MCSKINLLHNDFTLNVLRMFKEKRNGENEIKAEPQSLWFGFTCPHPDVHACVPPLASRTHWPSAAFGKKMQHHVQNMLTECILCRRAKSSGDKVRKPALNPSSTTY